VKAEDLILKGLLLTLRSVDLYLKFLFFEIEYIQTKESKFRFS
jgi:hypothetical protein